MKVRAPRNYRLTVEKCFSKKEFSAEELARPNIKMSFVVKLHFRGEWIGYVEMMYDCRPTPYESFYETHCSLDEEHRGKKLGCLMYSKAFEVAKKAGIPVKSSLLPSTDAMRLWESKSLNKLWEIEKQGWDRYVVVGERLNARNV